MEHERDEEIDTGLFINQAHDSTFLPYGLQRAKVSDAQQTGRTMEASMLPQWQCPVDCLESKEMSLSQEGRK